MLTAAPTSENKIVLHVPPLGAERPQAHIPHVQSGIRAPTMPRGSSSPDSSGQESRDDRSETNSSMTRR